MKEVFYPDVSDLLVRSHLRDHNISVVNVNILQVAASPDFYRFYKRTSKIKKYTLSNEERRINERNVQNSTTAKPISNRM